MTLEEMLNERAKQCELFSNPIRILISLTIQNLEEAGWADIKKNVEKISGPLNPNTLSFHLGKLIDSKLIEKIGTSEQPKYSSTKKNEEEIRVKIGPILIEKLEERIKD